MLGGAGPHPPSQEGACRLGSRRWEPRTHRRRGAGGSQDQLVPPLLHFKAHLSEEGRVGQPLLLHPGYQVLVLAVVFREVPDGVHHPLRQDWGQSEGSCQHVPASETRERCWGRHRNRDSVALFLRMCYGYASKVEIHLQHGAHACTHWERVSQTVPLLKNLKGNSKGRAYS